MNYPERENLCTPRPKRCEENPAGLPADAGSEDPKDLEDNKVKLVAYVVVSIEPGEEKFLSTGYLMVVDPMTTSDFVAWVIAVYIQSLAPDEHPSHESKQYLRVNYSVLERWDKPPYDFEEDQVRALRAIDVALAKDGEEG